ncbi:MAG: all-trans-retinol 13,14-reductase [Chlamydiales bacterium]
MSDNVMAEYDVIVIGSGAGGLASAVALAQAGKRVLVLEQHYVPGGWCHSFQLKGYRFSPGVHYIGELGLGGRMRQIYEGLGITADLSFCEINPKGYDHILLGKECFDIPKGRGAFGESLKARFPKEKKGIDGYLDTIEGISRELGEVEGFDSVSSLLTLPFRAPKLTRWGFFSAQSLIHHWVKDPSLRAVLGAQAGDHGLPPSLVPAPVHAGVAAHYFGGAYYPLGGAFAIPTAFVRALKHAGGEIRLRSTVDQIILESGKAVGVRLADGSEVRAQHVVSNADPDMTFRKMIGTENLSRKLHRKLERTRYSVSALSLFMAVDMDLRAAGLDSGNYWYYPKADVEGTYSQGMKAWGAEVKELSGFFLTATTLKDPSKMRKGHHTLEAFAFVDYDSVKKWVGGKSGDRAGAYEDFKNEIQSLMLRTAEEIVPGLQKNLVFSELGTPLTNQHYLGATRGNIYGTEKSLFQLGPWSFPIRSEIDNLFLCGASTYGHGVQGATFSGLVAAQEILGCSLDSILSQKGPPVEIYPSENLNKWPESLQKKIEKAQKKILKEAVT